MNKLPEEYCIINATANQIMEISKKYYGDTVGIVRNWEIFNCAKSLNYRSDRNRTHEQYIEFKYLPQFTYEEWKELYYSKEFVLPEKWRIEVTKENSKILTEWKLKVSNGYYNNKAGGFLYIAYNGEGRYDDKYPEITFEEFKEYVLKEPKTTTMEKKIIGYKLKDSCKQFEDALIKISGIQQGRGVYIGRVLSIEQWTCSIEEWGKAGVLGLWFDAVYEEKPIFTMAGYNADFSQDGYVQFGCKIFNKRHISVLTNAIEILQSIDNSAVLDITGLLYDGDRFNIHQLNQIKDCIK